ncbi:MAG: hypothetical protein IKY66_05480 [Bacteroidales bacterium]|nr:hypothetical protein [Bacteroidales bacterium]
MGDGEWIALIGLLASLMIPIMTMFIRLNSTLSKLNANMEREHDDGLRRTQRLDAHSCKLDEHEVKITNHEVRIQHLEDHRNE